MEFPEETTEDDDESSSSYQSAKDNLNSKSEVVTKSELLDAVDSANTPETLNSPQQTNKKSDETIAVASPKNDVTLKLKDAYKSNKTVSTPNPVVLEGLTLQKIEFFAVVLDNQMFSISVTFDHFCLTFLDDDFLLLIVTSKSSVY